MSLAMESPPEAKKIKMEGDFGEIDGPSESMAVDDSPETAEAQDSPAGPSSARSSNGSTPPEDELIMNPLQSGNLLDFISKSLLSNVFKMDQLPLLMPDSLHSTPPSHHMLPPQPVVPGAVALASMPTAKLFNKDDWSWHRNPAASIRSGGTNKQTPVWKYFVYDKADNLSRCIVADCTYTLKGPHTSTLACHLKKHPVEYAEFTKLKNDYSRERAVSQMPPSPASSSSGHSTVSGAPPTKLTEAMLNHNNNIEPQQQQQPQLLHEQQQLQQQQHSAQLQLEKMHQAAMAAAAAAAAAAASAAPQTPKAASNQQPANRFSSPPPPQSAQMPSVMNPFGYLMNPAAAGSVNPMIAQSLMQQGMSIGPQGQLILTKKWRKDERKQREMEHRLSLFISSARLPSSIVNDAAFRELLESAQPKFCCPTDASQIEQVLTVQHGRLQMAVRQALHAVRKMALMVDCIAVAENVYRVAITVSLPSANGPRETLLLALRPLEVEEEQSVTMKMVEPMVLQAMAENGLTADKITRIIVSGVEREEEGARTIGGVEIITAYRPRLLAVFMHIIDTNDRIQELKKRFCELIVTLISQEGLMGALIKATGRPINLPFTESFVALLEAIHPIREELVAVLSSAGIEVLSSDDWKLASLLLAVLSCLSPPKAVASALDSIDTLLPSLMQILGILSENEGVSPGLAEEMRREMEALCGSVSSPSSSLMESDFLVATALNPERILLLNEEQTQAAKRELERRVQQKMARQEEASSRKRPFNSLDQLLATVIDRRGGASDDSSTPSSSIYPDFAKKKEPAERNRFAEAIVQAYFDEVTQGDGHSSSAASSTSFSNRHLPPAAFWHANTHRCPQLSEIALELLSIPATTPGVEGIFGVKSASFDVSSLLQLPDRLERDTVLRFNRALLAKTM